MKTQSTAWTLLRCNSFILRGEILFTADKFYPPDIVEAWKNTLVYRIHRWLEWQYIEGYKAQLHIINGDAEIVLDEIRVQKLDLATFARTYTTSKPH